MFGSYDGSLPKSQGYYRKKFRRGQKYNLLKATQRLP